MFLDSPPSKHKARSKILQNKEVEREQQHNRLEVRESMVCLSEGPSSKQRVLDTAVAQVPRKGRMDKPGISPSGCEHSWKCSK